ncbi:medium-chain acyl-[acyl-carrier-protein] hydrolase [Agrobacterium vitis]|nr:medium-chain acyl-[acyl-carrier-protein] hydrolase [Agrobacterium vitis]MBE1436377.1 medium-chain acyl-[acyl-carrier-protein] hydrolase [Agrobacterium vitis]
MSYFQTVRTTDRPSSDPVASRWFVVPKPVANADMRLICLPYAGGTATAFHGWWRSLPDNVEVISVQLPGRGSRFKETPYRRMDALVADLLAELLPILDRPYMMFGHSMGAVAAFELLRLLPHHLQPQRLFASGRGAPHLPPVQKEMHRLNDAEFIEELRLMQGTPEQVLNDTSLMAMVLPALRADFEALETWQYRPGNRLTIPITALGGDRDILVPFGLLNAWGEQTEAEFEARIIPGGHFFLHSDAERVLDIIGRRVSDSRI